MEIEKKFLIKTRPEGIEGYEKKEIEQGYLASKPTIRIRKSNDEYFLTYKRALSLGDKEVIVNDEVELLLTKESYEHLKKKVDGNIIEKTRYLIPLSQNLVGEYDVFKGSLKGLEFIEVEFDSTKAAEAFQAPEWFGRNVSNDKRFSNKYLSGIESLEDLGLL